MINYDLTPAKRASGNVTMRFLVENYPFNPFPATVILGAPRSPSMRRPTVYRSRKLRSLSERPPSTQASLPQPRRKMLAMWPVRVA
jgi:hypothetical protein